MHRDVERQRAQESGEVVGVGGAHQHLGGAADAEPGERRQRRVRLHAPAQVGGSVVDRKSLNGRGRRGHGDRVAPRLRCSVPTRSPSLALRADSAVCGSSLRRAARRAHCVMRTGAEATTNRRGRGESRCTILRQLRRAGDGSGTTLRWPRARSPSTNASRFTPSIGASPAGYTSATITVPASFMQVQNSSNSE